MESSKLLVSRYPLFTGFREGDAIHQRIRAGDASLKSGDDYYELKMNLFPFSYYMKKNQNSDSSYTVYATKKESNGATRLANPIGRAQLPDQVKTHLQIRIPLLKLHLYMSLHPVQ